MNNQIGIFHLRKKLLVLLAISLIFSAMSIVFIPSKTFAKEEYDMNSPLVKSVTSRLSMEGHAEHDLSTCATKLRYYEEVVELLNDGFSEEEVIDHYVSMYGEEGLRAPNKSGFSLLAWVIPFIAIVIVAIGIYVIMRNKMKSNDASYSTEAPLESTEEEVLSSYIDEERKKYY